MVSHLDFTRGEHPGALLPEQDHGPEISGPAGQQQRLPHLRPDDLALGGDPGPVDAGGGGAPAPAAQHGAVGQAGAGPVGQVRPGLHRVGRALRHAWNGMKNHQPRCTRFLLNNQLSRELVRLIMSAWNAC